MKKCFIALLIMLALFILVLSGCSEKESDLPGKHTEVQTDLKTPQDTPTDEDPPHYETTENIDFGVQCIRTGGYNRYDVFPNIRLFNSREALSKYFAECREKYYANLPDDLVVKKDPEYIAKYTDEFFLEKQLVLIVLEEGSGSIRHEVTSVSRTTDNYGNNTVAVNIKRIVPEVGTDDMAKWHIFVELGSDIGLENRSDIELYVDGQRKNDVMSDGVIDRDEALLIARVVKTIYTDPVNARYDYVDKCWYVFCHEEGEPDGMADSGHQTIKIWVDGDNYKCLIDPLYPDSD